MARNAESLMAALRRQPASGSAELCARLGGVNRSTLMRALRELGDSVVSCGRARRTRYALRRALRGDAQPIPLYRVDSAGRGHQLGQLSLISPSGAALAYAAPFPWPLDREMAEGWFPGLPYPIADMRPQGFLGRHFARHHALDLGVAADPAGWSDDDLAHVLAMTGYDQPGDLILGDVAYRRFLECRKRGGERALCEAEVEAAYPRLAEAALARGDAGSSAGGEFPKFLARRELAGRRTDALVKFSGSGNSPAVRRWSDLLVCEHLASLALLGLDLPVAESAIYRLAGRTFLEVVRFDRHGDFGRSPVCTLASLGVALLGVAGEAWPKTAHRLHAGGWLPSRDLERVALIWAFGKLIGNTDMHEGNLAFRPGLALAPVYDMLPMMYAPLRGGEIPDRKYSPDLPLPAESAVWPRAAQAALLFWRSCAEDQRISAVFRRTCASNGRILASLLAGQA